METRFAADPVAFRTYTTEQIRRNYLVENVLVPDEIKMVYSHLDRMIVGGVCPRSPQILEAHHELRTDSFLAGREMGAINIGGAGTIEVDGTTYHLERYDGLYVGMGHRHVVFASDDPDQPAKFYLNSALAHHAYQNEKIDLERAEPTHLGTKAESNERTIYKYIHPDGVKSCQLTMGLTLLKPNSVWNTMPCHTHARRTESYLYFNLPDDGVVFHFMGEPHETRHLVVRNEQAILSPGWSIHSGAGTSNYAFIWCMAGENQTFSDMDAVSMSDLR